MSSSHAFVRVRIPLLIAMLLAAGVLVASLPGCGDDDPVAPGRLPDLAGADSAFVTLHILGAMRTIGDRVYLDWMNIDTRPTTGLYDLDNAVFHGEQTVTTEFYSERDIVHLTFDPRTGSIDSLYCRSSYMYPRGAWSKSLTARAIPFFSSYETVEGRQEYVWRLAGVMTCTVIDTATYNNSSGNVTLLTWSCAGDEEPFIEIRLTN
jgi:hypothetical protein